MMKPIRMTLLSAVTTLVAAADAPPQLAPAQAEAMLDRYGPPGAAWPRFDDVRPLIIRGVESGDARWLALLPRLRTGGNAAFNESLPIAVSEALKRRPSNVLRMSSVGYPVGQICGDIEIEPSAAEIRAYYARTVPVVRAVSAPGLREARDACLDSLAHREKHDLARAR